MSRLRLINGFALPGTTKRTNRGLADGATTGATISRRRLMLMRLALSGSTVVLACAAAEAILRFTWDRPGEETCMFDLKTCFRPDAELGWLPRPNMRGVHPVFEAVFTTNSRGLRDREYTVPKPPGVRRVVVLGDSFAWGHGVADHEVFTEALEARLPDTEVMNLGVTAFDLLREFRYLQREGMRYKPEVVIVALCQNDIPAHGAPTAHRARAAAIWNGTTAGAPRRNDGSRAGRLRRVKRFLNTHCRLFALGVEAINAHKPLARAAVRLGLKEELAGFEKLDNNLHAALIDWPPKIERAMKDMQAEILRLDSYVRARGSRLLLALIPSLQAVDRRALIRTIAYTRYDTDDFDVDKPYRVIERFAARQGIAVCNPLEAFRRRDRRGEKLFLRNDMHFNAAGHRAFAQALEPVVTALLVDRPPETPAGGATRLADRLDAE